ncbi:hypothetical protein [Robertmurraya massiliosenegalensis]|uniref:hypothetical protein n=1 Tax=Robertmurraya massiliosenegalensis TaxID=1287657 RepID=UPI000312FDEB|nr:hypothetical protein [Robertmurraya massiliosenegalensis]
MRLHKYCCFQNPEATFSDISCQYFSLPHDHFVKGIAKSSHYSDPKAAMFAKEPFLASLNLELVQSQDDKWSKVWYIFYG